VTRNAYERLISDSAVWVDEAWLPSERSCKELADLKAEHLRLLVATHGALQALGVARRDAALVVEQRSEALTAAILAGEDPNKVKFAEPDTAAVDSAEQLYLSTANALERFVEEARAEILGRASDIRQRMAEQLARAAELRAEAQRTLAEAEAMEADPQRMNNWLDRYTGESPLGPLAFERMPEPWVGPMPGGAKLMMAEGESMGVGSDLPTVEELNALALARVEEEEDAVA
jgi:hypothetical protein